jgi:hypothetical protein
MLEDLDVFRAPALRNPDLPVILDGTVGRVSCSGRRESGILRGDIAGRRVIRQVFDRD